MLILASLISWNHIHPVLVHFSTALLPASLVSDALGKYLKRRSLNAGAWWMLLYGAIVTPLTALAGWMWAAQFKVSMSQNLPELGAHRWLGIFLCVTFAVLAIWRRKSFVNDSQPGALYLVTVILAVGALMYQGYLGGQMTIG